MRAGVRYPAMLLPEVVAMLTTASNSLGSGGQQLLQNGQLPGQLSGEALQAASLGAGGALRTEPVSPIKQKAVARAFRWASAMCLAHHARLD